MRTAPLVLYSTNTWLAYTVAERFYGGEHYVWCTPYFSVRSAPPYASVPPTSCPGAIYHQLDAEVRAGDRHSGKIKENRDGIKRGAKVMLLAGTIDEHEHEEIEAIVDNAQIQEFRPMIYVIPAHLVADRLGRVAVADRAHPLSVEYTIERLPRSAFDVIDLER